MAETENGRKLPSLRGLHIVMATILVAIVAGLYFGIDRSAPVKFLDGSVTPQEVTAGQPLTVLRSVEWLRFDCTNTVVGYIEDAAGGQDKQVNFSAPTPDRDRCTKDGRCIVNSRSSPPDRGIKTHDGMAIGEATYRVTVVFRCGRLGSIMSPIEVMAPPLKFSIR